MPRQPIDGPLKPPGPIYPPKQPKPSKTTANYESAVLAMVDDVNKPTVATVYINNTLPPDDGYSIPSSMGVTFKAAPAAWNSSAAYNPGDYASVNAIAYKCVTANTNSQPPNANWTTPSGVAFWNDPVLLDGGSWVTVDTVNKVIVSIQEGESNSPPVNPSDLFQYIRHNGAYNTTGNFVNPGPIDTTQLVTGSLSLTPNITNVGTLTMGAAGNGTTDFTVTSFQVDSVGTTGTSKWLAAIYLVASLTGQNKWGIYGALSPDASGTYTGTWGGVGSGNNAYDLGIVYVDLIGNISNVGVLYTNRAPNTLWASLPRIAGSPTFTAAGLAVTYAATSPNNYNINVAFTTTAPQYCAQIVVYLTNHGSATPIMYQYIPVTGTGSGPASVNVNTAFTNLPDGTQTYDIYGQYVAVDGEQTTAGNIYTTSAFTAPPPGSGGSMPANTTPSVNTINFVTSNGWTETVELTFNLATAQTTATWLHSLELIYRPTNISYVPYGTTYAAGATSLTVYWPFYGAGGNPSASSTITISGYDASHVFHSESLTVSAVGTPTTGSSGFTTNTLTVSALVNNYNTSINVTYSSSTWVSTGTLLPANTGASYTGLWTVPGFCDLGVYLVDYTGGRSNPSAGMYSQGRWIRTLNNIGSGAVGLIPNFSAGAITYANTGNGAYDALSAVTFDGLGTITNPWLLDLEILTAASTVSTTLSANATSGTNTCTVTSASGLAIGQEIILGGTIEHNLITGISGTTVTVKNNWTITHTSGASVTANDWKHYGFIPPNDSGSYNLDWISLGSGNTYVLGVRYIDTNGGRSWVGNIGTTAANPIVTNNNNQPAMPSGATFTASSVTTNLYEGGMHTLLAGAGHLWLPEITVGFTLGDSNNPDSTHWGTAWVPYIRQHSSSSVTDKTTYLRKPPVKIQSNLLGNGTSQSVPFGVVTPGQAYDFSFALMDGQGNETPLPTTQPVTNYSVGTTNLPHCPFPGGYVNEDGSWSNVDGVSSTQTFSFTSGQVFHASCKIAKGSSTGNSWLILGNATNGYGLQFYPTSGGGCGIWKFVGGTASQIGTAPVAFTSDTAYHSFRLTVTPGATNYIEANLDGNQFIATDFSLTLTSGTWPVTLITAGSNGKVLEYNAIATPGHFGGLPPVIHNTHIPPWQALPGDNSPLQSGLLTGRHFHNAPTNDTSDFVDSSGLTLYSRHAPAIKTVIDQNSNLYNNEIPLFYKNTSGFYILPVGADPIYPSASGLYFGGGNDSGLYAQFRVKVNTTGKTPGYAIGFNFGFTYGGSPGSYTKTSGYEVQLSVNASGQTIVALYKWAAGSSTQVYSYTVGLGFGDGSLHTVRVWAGVVSSTLQISLSFDGQTGSYTDTSSYYSSGQFGFANNNTDSAYSITDLSVQVSAHLHGAMSSAVKSRILSDSTLHVDSGVGPVSGNLPYSNHDPQVTSTILPSTNADGSNLYTGQVSTRTMIAGAVTNNKVGSTSVSGTQVFPACYSTQLTNADDGLTTWADSNNASITEGTTLTNGEVIHYNTGAANYAYPPALNPRQRSYTCPANGSVTCVLKHVSFASGGSGVPRVYFTGTTAGGTTTTNTTSNVSGSQNVTWWASGTLPGPVNYGQSNGSTQSYSVTTSVAPSAANPVSLNLTSINCPSDLDGSSSLTIKLIAPDGSTVINTWTGITATSWSYSYQTGTYGSGQYTWQIQAIATNLHRGADSPYNSSYTVTYSGTAGYAVTTGASGNTYVLALDGSTQRLNALDGNIKFTQLAPDTVAFQVSNSAASALSFSVGVDVTGV